jgi:hypothetical protein
MKAFLLIAFICFTSLHTFSQQNIITWNEKQPLQWIDFAGPVKENSSFDAESFAEVKYHYKFNSPSDFHFEVFANFNKHVSWYKKKSQSEDLLKHEQVHFDIAALYAKLLKEAFETFQYSENYHEEIQEIFSQKKNEYHLMQQQYDEETNHSLNKESQKRWEKFVLDKLNEWKFKFNYAKK